MIKRIVFLINISFFSFFLKGQISDSTLWSYEKLKLFDKAIYHIDTCIEKFQKHESKLKYYSDERINTLVLKGDYLGAIKFYNSVYNGADTLNTGVWDYLFQNLYCSNKNYDFALLSELRLLNELFIKKNDSSRFFLNQLLEIKIEFEKFNCDSFLRIQKLRFQLPGKNEMVTDKYYLFDIYGLIYQKKRNFSSAFEYFTKSNHLADSVNDLNLKLHSLERLKNITLAKSDAKNQIFYANELDYIRDSVNRLELKEISIAFNFLNELNKIRTSNLVANLTKIKNLQSKNSENIKYFICIVLLLLVLFIILIAFLIKSKNKRLKKVLSEQENELLNLKDCEIQNKNLLTSNEILINELNDLKNSNYLLNDLSNLKLKELDNTISKLINSVCSSEEDIVNHLSDYFVFSSEKIKMNNNFFSFLNSFKKLRPGKMFAGKGNSEMQGVSEKSSIIFLNILNSNKLNDLEILPVLIELKIAISEKRIKNYNDAFNHMFKDSFFANNLYEGNFYVSVIHLDKDTSSFDFYGYNTFVMILRNGEIVGESKSKIIDIDNLKVESNCLTSKLNSNDCIFMVYGSFSMHELHFIREFLKIISFHSSSDQQNLIISEDIGFLKNNFVIQSFRH